jgi:hypothetical protein
MAGMAHRGVNYWLIDIPTGRGATKTNRRHIANAHVIHYQEKQHKVMMILEIRNDEKETTRWSKFSPSIHGQN